MQNEIFYTYRFFNEKKERYSIAGIEKHGKLQILRVKCNKKDEFNKKHFKRLVDYHFGDSLDSQNELDALYTPEFFFLDIKEGDSARYTFIEWCNENMWKLTLGASIANNLYIVKDNVLKLYIQGKQENHIK